MSRLLIVSNRLPVTLRRDDEQAVLDESVGGLATGLAGPHRRSDGLWIGWPGDVSALPCEQRDAVLRELAERNLVPVALSPELVAGFYERYSNGLLWPLFHYQQHQLPLEAPDPTFYEQANQVFADAVVQQYRPGDRIWVHDYQLLRVPALLRERLPDARIGLFLHIPFPASEVFRTLPARERLLEGMLGADLIGFHTPAYMRHFASSVLRLLGVSCEIDRIRWRGRAVRLGAFPMGIDATAFSDAAEEPSVHEEVRALRGAEDVRLVLGVDRLDYTKGIPRRLLAFERLLLDHPELRERVKLVQVAVPSREDVRAYQEFRAAADGLVGRIHGAFATPSWVPVHWMYRSLSRQQLVALYRAADVMLVTPVRDGMNLVAKEFVASRVDEDGVLVLSEFAGAADELAEAIRINPYDVPAAAEAYHRALTMPRPERRSRMRALRRRVFAADVHAWVARFLGALEAIRDEPESQRAADPRVLAAQVRGAQRVAWLLDYDGTLVPFAPTPELAFPDPELRALLGALAARPGTQVHVVSGRARETLEEWFGNLPIGLHAEHGLEWRMRPDDPWKSEATPQAWREPVLRILRDYAVRTPGSLVEEKTASLAWHYRAADPEFGETQARDLRLHLSELLSNAPVELLEGHRVIEVRPYGIHKGTLVPRIREALEPGTLLVALGDDRTDEDLFEALPSDALAIHVGAGPTRAPLRLANVAAVRRMLRAVLVPPG